MSTVFVVQPAIVLPIAWNCFLSRFLLVGEFMDVSGGSCFARHSCNILFQTNGNWRFKNLVLSPHNISK
jgi:hypothetical protein